MLEKRTRPPGVDITPGSVRQARQEAGLTLAQLAGDKLTRAAIHQVESGRSRPSMRTLQVIASATRKPVSYFLGGDEADGEKWRRSYAGLEELERLSVANRHADVIQLGDRLTSKVSDKGARAYVRYFQGRARVMLNEGQAALEDLKEAGRIFASIGDQWLLVQTMDMEACALFLLEDHSCLALAERALDECRRLDPMPPGIETRILGNLAAMHVAQRSWKQAIQYYEACLTAAGPVRDLRHTAMTYDGLGTAHFRLGDNQKAVAYANKALALHSMVAEAANVARAENNLGDLLTRTGAYEAAEQHLLKSLELCEDLGIDHRSKAYTLNSLAELHLRRNRLDEASREAAQARAVALATGERTPIGTAAQIQAKIAAADGDIDAAADHFETAIGIFSELRLQERLRECRIEFAQMLEDAGRIREASNEWKQAAYLGAELAPAAVPFEVYLGESRGSAG